MGSAAVRVTDAASSHHGRLGFVEATDALGPRVLLVTPAGRRREHVWFAASQLEHGTLFDDGTFTPSPRFVPRLSS